MSKVLIILLFFVAVGLYFWKISTGKPTFQVKQSPSSNLKLTVFSDKNPPFSIHKPSEAEMRKAFQNATFDLENGEVIQLPVDQLVTYVQSFFYPPNGFAYDQINIHITDYAQEDGKSVEQSLVRGDELRNNKVIFYVQLSGIYESCADKYILHGEYPQNSVSAAEFTLNFPAFGVSPNLRNKLSDELNKIPQIKQFREKFNLGAYSGETLFYRLGYLNRQNSSEHEEFVAAGLPIDKDIIKIRFMESGTAIPEAPRASITAYINTEDYSVIKTREY